MAIVSRRVLQRLINDSTPYTTHDQRLRFCRAIDAADDQSLAAEWELLVLSGLSQLITIEHEPLLGKRRPDVLAGTPSGGDADLFIADIATAYETGYHDANPVEELRKQLFVRAQQLGLKGHAFFLTVEGERVGEAGKQKMVLRLPEKASIATFVSRALDPFLKDCFSDPTRHRELEVNEPGVSLKVEFKPHDTVWGQTHPSFTTRYSKTHNSIFRVLKSKARQLKDTAFQGPRGVILCAADVDLSERNSGHDLKSITTELFRQHRSVTFVLTLWAVDRGRAYESRLFHNPEANWPLGPRSKSALERFHTLLPEALNDSRNALNEIRFWRWKKGRYFYGGWKMSQTRVQVSLRFVMEYLAGRVDRDEFVARHGGDQGLVSIFEDKLRRGQLVNGTEIVHEPDRDDDWLVFHFGAPDPALAPLKPPRTEA